MGRPTDARDRISFTNYTNHGREHPRWASMFIFISFISFLEGLRNLNHNRLLNTSLNLNNWVNNNRYIFIYIARAFVKSLMAYSPSPWDSDGTRAILATEAWA